MASTVASQSFHLNIYKQLRGAIILLTSYFLLLTSFTSCSSSKFIYKQAQQIILSDSNLTSAHVGISIYDPSTNKYLYNHDGDKYFIPGSNTKLLTCYAAMKHLGDSLVGAYVKEYDTIVAFLPSADPTFLHPDYKNQPLLDYFKATKKRVTKFSHFSLNDKTGKVEYQDQVIRFGNGWAWNDYEDDFMAERSSFPAYGNVVRFYFDSNSQILRSIPRFFAKSLVERSTLHDNCIGINISRSLNKDTFLLSCESQRFYPITTPFRTSHVTTLKLLEDTLKTINLISYPTRESIKEWKIIHSQPTDSVLKPMMHRSDNFFAEQTLLMVSNEMTGVMNDEKIIDSLLKTDFSDLPQKPRWVDGSGLSRYNLFSPNDLVTVLNKMKTDFSWDRITTILATGGEGTLTNYYLDLKNRIFAKTGTLSNNVALSGFLITKQNKTLIFSVLVNNHMGSTTKIRKAVEKFLTSVVEKY